MAFLVRQRFLGNNIPNNAYERLDASRWIGADANGKILAILGQAPTEGISAVAFQNLSNILVAWWDQDADQHSSRSKERNHDTESALTSILESFVLKTSLADATSILKPIVDAIDRHPRKVHWLIQGIICIEDRNPNTEQFWAIWELFSEKVRKAKWLQYIDAEHAIGSEVMSAIFLTLYWKEGVRHWRSLEGNAWRVHKLFDDLPAASIVLDDYLRFLYHIGEQSLPDTFIRIAKRFRVGKPSEMLRRENTVFMLEVLLRRYVYGRPLEMKQQKDLREAILFLLDLLVENGSSAAFRMRDDFVTPVASA